MKFGSRNMTQLRLSQKTEFSLAAILKMAQNTTFAMEISPETSFIFKSTLKAIKKTWIWRIVGGCTYTCYTCPTIIDPLKNKDDFPSFQLPFHIPILTDDILHC